MTINQTENAQLLSPPPNWIADSDWLKDFNEWKTCKQNLLHFEKQNHLLLNSCFYRVIRRLDSLNDVENFSTLDFDFNPFFQDFLLHSLNVLRNGEVIDKLSSLNMKLIQRERRATEKIFSDKKTALIILYDIREGDILEYSYSYSGINPIYHGRHLDCFYFTLKEEAKRVFYRLISPKDILFKYHRKNIEPLKHESNGEQGEWIWDISNSKARILEDYYPSWYDPYTWLQISSFKTWEDVAEWGKCLFPIINDFSDEILYQVNEWKAECKTQEELVITIIRFVQNSIRYLSLDENLSGYIAANPNEVFKRRFGDCKDKTLLLLHLFKLINITSNPVLVNTCLLGQISNWLPSPSSFDHAILRFKFLENVYWIDPTISYQGGSLINISTLHYQYGLVIADNEICLETIPEKNNSKQVTHTFINLEHQSCELFVISNFHGHNADRFRQFYRQMTIDELTSHYKEFYSRFYKRVISTKPVEVKDNLNENTICVNEFYRIEDFTQQDQNTGKFKSTFFPFSINEVLIKDIDLNRSSPIGLPFRVNFSEKITVKLVQDLSFKQMVDEIENDYLKYKVSWSKDENKNIILNYSLKYLKSHVEVKDIPEFCDSMEEILKSLEATLTWAPKSQNEEKTYSWWILLFFYFIYSISKIFFPVNP